MGKNLTINGIEYEYQRATVDRRIVYETVHERLFSGRSIKVDNQIEIEEKLEIEAAIPGTYVLANELVFGGVVYEITGISPNYYEPWSLEMLNRDSRRPPMHREGPPRYHITILAERRWCALPDLDYDEAILLAPGDRISMVSDIGGRHELIENQLRIISVSGCKARARMRDMSNRWRIRLLTSTKPIARKPRGLRPSISRSDVFIAMRNGNRLLKTPIGSVPYRIPASAWRGNNE